MPITLRGVRSVRGGSIEAIRWPWRSTGGRCPIPCKTPEPHGPMRTMEVRTRTRIRSRAEVRGPAGGFGFAWRDLSPPSDSDLAAEQHFTDGIVPVCARYCRENFGIESGPGQTPQFAMHKILVSPATDIGWRAAKHCTPIRR
jgi:hypothetical protein